jgi:hypothetical protein
MGNPPSPIYPLANSFDKAVCQNDTKYSVFLNFGPDFTYLFIPLTDYCWPIVLTP